MKNLKRLQTHVIEQEIINGNTIEYTYLTTSSNHQPDAINFSIKRGQVGEDEYNANNTITGVYYPDIGKFDVQNNSFQDGDFDIYKAVLATCQGIMLELAEKED